MVVLGWILIGAIVYIFYICCQTAQKAQAERETDPEKLRKWSKAWGRSLRMKVARNPQTPIDALTTLSKDNDFLVREGVAENTKTSSTLLAELSKDTVQWVRARVASNPNTPTSVLKELSKDQEWFVRQYVAGNSETPPEILLSLIKDKSLDVCKAAVYNLCTPIEWEERQRIEKELILAIEENRKTRAVVAEVDRPSVGVVDIAVGAWLLGKVFRDKPKEREPYPPYSPLSPVGMGDFNLDRWEKLGKWDQERKNE